MKEKINGKNKEMSLLMFNFLWRVGILVEFPQLKSKQRKQFIKMVEDIGPNTEIEKIEALIKNFIKKFDEVE